MEYMEKTIVINENTELVSVIVPVYKVEPYLRTCLDSIAAQTYQTLEVILVDDGSPDRCGEICDAYAEKDCRFFVIHQPNGGLSAARNAGVKAAKGKWICFVDSDDAVHPDYVLALYEACRKTGSDLAICRHCTQINEMKSEIPDMSVYTPYEISRELNREGDNFLAVAWNKLYAAYLVKETPFPEGRVHEDEAVAHRLLWNCKKCVVIEKKLYFYRQRESSIMGDSFSPRRMDAAAAYEDRIAFYTALAQHELVERAKVLYCYFLAVNRKKIEKYIDAPQYWLKKLRSLYKEILGFGSIAVGKKLSLGMLILTPNLHQRIKAVYRRFENE